LNALLVTALILAACGEGMLEGEPLSDEESSRELASGKTCTVAAESVAVRTCWATGREPDGTKRIACGLLGPVFATQALRSALPLASLTSPLDADEKLLGARLESLGLVDVARSLPQDLAVFNQAITDTQARLAAAASGQCRPGTWKLAVVDGLLDAPRGLGFVCAETVSGLPLLDCEGTSLKPADQATSSPASALVNGVQIVFAKTGCGSFRYALTNTSATTKASYTSAVSGIALAPACQGTLAPGATQTCSVTGIKGGGTRRLSYRGSVTRGGSSVPFSFELSVRCD
jgi:hypothetical protein